MNRHLTLPIAALASLIASSPSPASSKPCRDKDGRVIACVKVRKPSPRCKDEQGRFVACPPPHADTPPRP